MPPVHKPTASSLLEALRALDGDRPPMDEGWRSIVELMKESGSSEPVIRRKLKRLDGRVEKRRHGGFMFYRIKP